LPHLQTIELGRSSASAPCPPPRPDRQPGRPKFRA
jgi:hypothetical protein